MGYPALTDLATFVTVLGVGVPSVFIFSKVLKLNPQSITFSRKRREALLGLLVFVAVVFGTFGIYDFYDKIWVRATLTADPVYVLRGCIAIIVILIPMAIALKWSKQSFQSIAVTRKGLKKSLAIGILTSLTLILFLGILSPYLGGGFVGFSVPIGYFLLSYIIIGFGEEIIFRGYIQTRLTSNNGAALGIGVTSVFYAIYSVPMGYFCYSGNIPLSLAYGAWRVSSGLLYSYTFYKSQNVVSSSIVHMFLVWGGLLFGLYL